MARLSDDEARRTLEGRPGWELAGSAIRRVYTFADFKSLNPHPDILINYNRVTLTPTTHDSGGLTERDFRLAGRIDA